MTQGAGPAGFPPDREARNPVAEVWRFLIGGPRRLTDRSLFHRLALVPLLAWVGLGADGLSSSAYGPEEAFRSLGEHSYLAVLLAAVMAGTIFVITAAYRRIIEEFPHGGGGYVVATKLLGKRLGVVSGAALLVDYVLTITVSIAAAGDALFSFLPLAAHGWKVPVEMLLIAGLTTLNIRGVRESVLALAPVFLVFLGTHVILIAGGILARAPALPATAAAVAGGFEQGLAVLGVGGLALALAHAYALGGGTYTGIEAVSNGLPILREPHVETGKRTMLYMAGSLAFTASGLLLCYLLWNVAHVEGKTLNAVLAERMFSGFAFGPELAVITILSEGALLVVAAQAGFLDGPRVLSNMAVDSWMPHRFSTLSSRLTVQNGIVLMGGASLAALLYTHGNVRHIVVMYSINVFLTFSLSMLGMGLAQIRSRREKRRWRRRTALFATGFLLCATILAITVIEKFREGGWITLLVTGGVVVLCFLIREHYASVALALSRLRSQLAEIPSDPGTGTLVLDHRESTAAVLVESYHGLGMHTVLSVFRTFPGQFKNLVFLSVGVVDSGAFKGEDAVDRLRTHVEESLRKYLDLARRMRVPATYRMAIGTDLVDEAEKLCLAVTKEFPRVTFFAGKVIFHRERWYERLLHHETAYAIQKRLQFAGQTLVILPARVH